MNGRMATMKFCTWHDLEYVPGFVMLYSYPASKIFNSVMPGLYRQRLLFLFKWFGLTGLYMFTLH